MYSTKKIINNYPIICNNHHVKQSKAIIDNIIAQLESNDITELRLSLPSITINCDKMCCPKIKLGYVIKTKDVIVYISDGVTTHILDYSMQVKVLKKILYNVIERVSLV